MLIIMYVSGNAYYNMLEVMFIIMYVSGNAYYNMLEVMLIIMYVREWVCLHSTMARMNTRF